LSRGAASKLIWTGRNTEGAAEHESSRSQPSTRSSSWRRAPPARARAGCACAALVAILVTWPDAALADEDETSIDLQFGGGVARIGQPGTDDVAAVPAFGLVGRMSYRLRDYLAAEAELDLSELGGTTRYDDVTGEQAA
jgi:hypothetical protein